MQYVGLVNFPATRARVTRPFVWWDDWFSVDELDRIVAHCSALPVEEATVIGGNNDGARSSKTAFVSASEETAFFFERMNALIATINHRCYGFVLNGWEMFQYTEYRASEAGHYDWHMDMALGEDAPADMIEPRKLSLSLMLNEPERDFTGGEFQINLGQQNKAQTIHQRRGRALAFPSWMIHRVTPVTAGVRRSIVVWVTGPKFS